MPPTLIDLDGFAHQTAVTAQAGSGFIGVYDTVSNTGGGVTFDTVTKRTATHVASLKIVEDGTNITRVARAITANLVVASFYFRVASAPASISNFFTMNYATGLVLRMLTDGKLRAVVGTTTQDTTGTYADGNWHRIDVRINTSASPFLFDWYVDGVSQTQVSAAGTAGNMSSWQLGSGLAAHNLTIWFQDFVISGTTGDYPIGDHLVLPLYPTGDGTHTLGTTNSIRDASAGTTNLYQSVDDWNGGTPDTATYLTYGSTTTGDAASNFAEFTMSDPDAAHTEIWDVLGIIAGFAAGTSADTADTQVLTGHGGTLIDHVGNLIDYSGSATVLGYYRTKLARPSGGWTNSNLAGSVVQWGFATDTNSIPRLSAVMLEYAALQPGVAESATVNESEGITDSKTNVLDRARTADEAEGITDAQAEALDRTRTISEAEGLTDAVTEALDRGRAASDPIGLTDTQASVLDRVRTADDPVGITDSTSTAATGAQTFNDPVGITDAATSVHDMDRSTADEAEGITDTVLEATDRARTLAESEGITDTQSTDLFTGPTFTADDPEGLTDALTRALVRARTIPEAFGITDTIAITKTIVRGFTEAVGITDSRTRFIGSELTVHDLVRISDALERPGGGVYPIWFPPRYTLTTANPDRTGETAAIPIVAGSLQRKEILNDSWPLGWQSPDHHPLVTYDNLRTGRRVNLYREGTLVYTGTIFTSKAEMPGGVVRFNALSDYELLKFLKLMPEVEFVFEDVNPWDMAQGILAYANSLRPDLNITFGPEVGIRPNDRSRTYSWWEGSSLADILDDIAQAPEHGSDSYLTAENEWRVYRRAGASDPTPEWLRAYDVILDRGINIEEPFSRSEGIADSGTRIIVTGEGDVADTLYAVSDDVGVDDLGLLMRTVDKAPWHYASLTTLEEAAANFVSAQSRPQQWLDPIKVNAALVRDEFVDLGQMVRVRWQEPNDGYLQLDDWFHLSAKSISVTDAGREDTAWEFDTLDRVAAP